MFSFICLYSSILHREIGCRINMFIHYLFTQKYIKPKMKTIKITSILTIFTISFLMVGCGLSNADKDGNEQIVITPSQNEENYSDPYDNSNSDDGLQPYPCEMCGGTGKIEQKGGGMVLDYMNCPSCGGSGVIYKAY